MGRFKNKPCQNCCKLFEPRSSNDKWCINCRTKTCDYCGKEFIVKNPSKVDSQKFCSKECQLKGRFNAFKLICQKCGNEFISKSPSGKLCDKCKTFVCKTCRKTFAIDKIRNEESIKYCFSCFSLIKPSIFYSYFSSLSSGAARPQAEWLSPRCFS